MIIWGAIWGAILGIILPRHEDAGHWSPAADSAPDRATLRSVRAASLRGWRGQLPGTNDAMRRGNACGHRIACEPFVDAHGNRCRLLARVHHAVARTQLTLAPDRWQAASVGRCRSPPPTNTHPAERRRIASASLKPRSATAFGPDLSREPDPVENWSAARKRWLLGGNTVARVGTVCYSSGCRSSPVGGGQRPVPARIAVLLPSASWHRAPGAGLPVVAPRPGG